MSGVDNEYISVHQIQNNKIKSEPEGLITVFQIQGKENTNKGLIMKAGYLENPHDILIREFELLRKFKCFMISRLYDQEELKKAKPRYQMIKIIICKKNDKMNNPIAYLCYNFHTDQYCISTHDNKIELTGKYTITFHFMEDTYKYIQLYENDTYMGSGHMMNTLTEYLFNENVLQHINK